MTSAQDHSYSLLYLDDDPMAIQNMKGLLQNHLDQVRPEYYGSPQKAINAHQERHYDIVISDLRLGTTTGVEVISQMKDIAPSSAYLLVSGDADLSAALAAVNELKAVRFLVKPCTQTDVDAGLADALRHVQETTKLEEINLSQGALERMGLAVASFNQSFALVHANQAARTLFQTNETVVLSSTNQLASTGTLSTAELHSQIKASFLSQERQGLPVACGSEGKPASLILYPLIDRSVDTNEVSYNLLVIDTAKSKDIEPAVLSQALNISLSEARVVRHLACGFSLEDTAESCNLSLSTVRTYLKNAYAKTGACRQAELVGLALRTAP